MFIYPKNRLKKRKTTKTKKRSHQKLMSLFLYYAFSSLYDLTLVCTCCFNEWTKKRNWIKKDRSRTLSYDVGTTTTTTKNNNGMKNEMQTKKESSRFFFFSCLVNLHTTLFILLFFVIFRTDINNLVLIDMTWWHSIILEHEILRLNFM